MALLEQPVRHKGKKPGPLADAIPETARRTLGRIKTILDTAPGVTENPAGWQGRLKATYKLRWKPRQRHHPTLALREDA